MTHARKYDIARNSDMTRRSFGLALGLSTGLAAGLSGMALATGRAFAAPSPSPHPAPAFPLRIAVARMGEAGLIRVPTEHQLIWAAFSTRLGGLVEEMSPVQPSSLIDLSRPADDGGAACAALARGFADRLGCSQVILYATTDGVRRDPKSDNWIVAAFQKMRSVVQVNDRAMGEAYLLDAGGGVPLAAASADADRASVLDALTGRRNEIDTLKLLTADLERRVQTLARAPFAAGESLAD